MKILLLSFVLAFSIANATVERNYSLTVMDFETGNTIYEKDEDDFRFPASLTKIMTSYLAFKALKEGKVKMETKVKISKNASKMPKSSVGFKAGEFLKFEDLLNSMLVISANDSAVAIAEKLAGSEVSFVKMMNREAKKLGLLQTNFANASGLHNPKQFTTSHDIAKLVRQIMLEFPEYLPLFSKKEFILKEKTFQTTNNLLLVAESINGFKTGFVNASGFNLVATKQDGNRTIIAVLMHIHAKNIRDNFMLKLLDYGFEKSKIQTY